MSRRQKLAEAVKRRGSPFGKTGLGSSRPAGSGGKRQGIGPSQGPFPGTTYKPGAGRHYPPSPPRKLGKVKIPARFKNRG